MARFWICQRKHRWEETNAAEAGAGAPVCPECGALATLTSSASLDRDPQDQSTVWNPGGWQAWPAPEGESIPELEGFTILGEVGRGGMGVVYQAKRVDTGTMVAVKVIRQDRLMHDDAVARFRREAQAASRLDHPNIVGVFDSDHTGDTHYLVMEFVDGITLEHLVDRQGPLAIDQACEYLRQAALGLQHAFEQGLVHRDIKPANLMVTPAPGSPGGSVGVVKILDMGVARMLQVVGGPPGDSINTLTQRGAVLGTPDYVAPEQLENPHQADIRADLYSLGCTLYFLLTGQVPFPGGSLLSKFDKQRWEAPKPVQLLRSEVPPGLEALLSKLMAKDPGERFAYPLELAQALEVLAARGYQGLARGALRLVRRLQGHSGPVWSAVFSPDGRWVLSGGKDRSARLWETSTGKLVRVFAPLPQEIRCVGFTPGGRQVVMGSGVTVRMAGLESGQEVRRFSGHSDAVRCLAFTADGKYLLTGSDDKSLRVWDVSSGRERQRLARHGGSITGLAVTSGGETALTASRDQTVRAWDLTSGQERGCMSGGGGAVLGLSLASGDQVAASAHFDTLLRLWDISSGLELRRLPGHKQMVTGTAFSADGRLLISGGQDQTVRLWDVESGRELACGMEHQGGIHAVSCQGNLCLSAGGDGVVMLWEMPV